jgi:hypothetical protein
MIDLSKLEVGDIVIFPGPFGTTVKSVRLSHHAPNIYFIEDTDGSIESHYFLQDGHSVDTKCRRSIIRIEKPAFDWSTVKWGMVFTTKHNTIVTYIGKGAHKNRLVFEHEGYVFSNFSEQDVSDLTRPPEHDIVE